MQETMRIEPRSLSVAHYLRPDLVTVEISPFSLGYRLKHGRRWQRQLARLVVNLTRAG